MNGNVGSERGRFTGIKVSPAGNSYALAYLESATYGNGGMLVKFDSSGAVQWQRHFTVSNGAFNPADQNSAVALDSSENIYLAGYFSGLSTLAILKYNSSGTFQWARSFSTNTGSNNITSRITVDSSGNVYAWGGSGTPAAMYLIKYNSSGVLQWQRKWSSSGYEIYQNLGRPQVLNDGSIAVGATAGNASGGSSNPMYIKLPADGSKTGSYAINGLTWTYAASSGTDVDLAPSLTFVTPTYTYLSTQIQTTAAVSTGAGTTSTTFTQYKVTL
jgi:hypothetical protein